MPISPLEQSPWGRRNREYDLDSAGKSKHIIANSSSHAYDDMEMPQEPQYPHKLVAHSAGTAEHLSNFMRNSIESSSDAFTDTGRTNTGIHGNISLPQYEEPPSLSWDSYYSSTVSTTISDMSFGEHQNVAFPLNSATMLKSPFDSDSAGFDTSEETLVSEGTEPFWTTPFKDESTIWPLSRGDKGKEKPDTFQSEHSPRSIFKKFETITGANYSAKSADHTRDEGDFVHVKGYSFPDDEGASPVGTSCCPDWHTAVQASTVASDLSSPMSSDYEDDIPLNPNLAILEPFRESLVQTIISAYFRSTADRGYEQKDTERTNEGRASDAGNSVTPSQESTNTPQNQRTSKPAKRKRGPLAPGSGDGDGEDEDESMAPQKKRARSQDQELNMACPFAKWKPLSYGCCNNCLFDGINRVKQHLQRRHKKPYYCPTCYETFKTQDLFYPHMKARSCSPKPEVEIEGLTDAQEAQIKHRSNRNLSKSEQWYSLYSILFPNSRRPDSIYADKRIGATCEDIQRYMATEGPRFVEQMARQHIPAELMPHVEEILEFSQSLIQHTLPSLFRRSEATRPGSSNPDSGSRASSDTPDNGIPTPDERKVDKTTNTEMVTKENHPEPVYVELENYLDNNTGLMSPSFDFTFAVDGLSSFDPRTENTFGIGEQFDFEFNNEQR